MTSRAHVRFACDHPPPTDGVWPTNASWVICSGVKRIPECVSTQTGNEWNSVCVWNCDKGEPYLAKVTGVQAWSVWLVAARQRRLQQSPRGPRCHRVSQPSQNQPPRFPRVSQPWKKLHEQRCPRSVTILEQNFTKTSSKRI
mmetsp:Transcript_24904/g.45567  ORF Transcript_24904/g.45567 Transcript_24904/m.45567 type:complete len:142 (+) Transcript_24904:191-616(+)